MASGSNIASNNSTSERAVLRIVVDHRLDVRLTVRKARLPQVLRVAAQHDHLLPGQARPQHQFVEPVDLDPALPDGGDRVGEPLCRWRPARSGPARSGIVWLRRDPELVDPDRQAVGPGHGERALLEHHHAHATAASAAVRSATPTGPPRYQVSCASPVGAASANTSLTELSCSSSMIAMSRDRVQRRDRLLVHLGERRRVVLGVGLARSSRTSPRPSAGHPRSGRPR